MPYLLLYQFYFSFTRLKDYQKPEQILGENSILKQLTKRLAERALQAEMTHHLGYAKHDYQGKADKETLDDFINHNANDDLLDDEQPSAKEGQHTFLCKP